MRPRPARRGVIAAASLFLVVLTAACGGPHVGVPSTDPLYEFEVGRTDFQRQHWLEAQTHLKRFLDLNPGHAEADSAQLLIALSLYNSKSYAEAAVEFSVLSREYPRSSLKDNGAYHECLCYFRQMRPAQFDPTFASRASNCLSEFLLRYPDSSYRGDAQARQADIDNVLAEKEYRLGVLFAKMKKPDAARIYLQGIVDTYPRSRWVPYSLYWIGRSQEDQGHEADAAQTYRRLLEAFPDHKVAKQSRQQLKALFAKHPELQSAQLQPSVSSDAAPLAPAPAAIDSTSRARP
jgi:outer membrane protein assembly factor BamD